MTTEADIGHGTKLQTGDDASPEVFTDIAEVTSISFEFSRDSIDVTHMQSPDGWREFIPALKDGGEITVEINYVPGAATVLALMAEFSLGAAAAVKNRRILWTDGSFLEFTGFLTGVPGEIPVDDKMSASATFKVTGKPVLTQAA